MTRKALLVATLLLASSLGSLAQKITVTGTVYEPEGEPALGASVVVAGETMGVITDFDGNYSIQVDANGSLVFSYVGCDTQTIPVDNRTKIDVHLTANSVALNEVVAIGYGAVRKQDATGSVAVIKPDEIEAGLATSTQDLLVGASPGVVVTTDGGNPTGGATIRIRGGSSLTASNDPLVVIDGVPQTNQGQGGGMSAMTMLNPSDIESMTILKDASATAIYGSRASNGVIIITTKKGRSGKPQVSFSANFAINTARKTLKVLNAAEFVEVVKSTGNDNIISQLGYDGEIYDTDWQKQVLRTSFSQDYNLSVGGAVGKMPYRVNVGYTNNQGILKTSGMQRVTGGITLTPKLFDDKLSITANVNGTYGRTDNGNADAVGAAISFDPTKPVYTNVPMQGNSGRKLYNGYYMFTQAGVQNENSTLNPVGMLNEVEGHNDTWSSTGNLQIDYALHFLPELHFNLNLGYQVSKNDMTSFTAANSVQAWRNTGLNNNGAAGAETMSKWHEIQQNTLLDFYINYKKDFEAIKSNLDVMAGYSWQRFNYFGNSQTYINSLGFVGADSQPGFTYADGKYYMDQSTHNAIGEAAAYARPDGWAFPYQLISFFGRLNYMLNDTYLLTFTLRDDASSRFNKNNRWGLFPSLALGWKINNCFGLKDSRWLNELKLRLGWGETGQQAIGDGFLYMPVYTISNSNQWQYPGYYFPGQDGYGNWFAPLYPNAYNTNIKWETTETWNAGIDMAVLNNRVTLSVDWYLRNTRDLLAHVPVKGSNTSDYMTRNIGKLRNYGVEFNATAKPVVTENFRWTTGVNVAWNRNEITELNDGTQIAGRTIGSQDTGLQWFEEGYPAYTFRVYQQVYDSNGNPLEGQYVDQNADGVIDDSDLIHYHSPEPKVTISWNNTFNFHNWDFGFSLRASLGNYVYNNNMREHSTMASISNYGLHNLLADTYIFQQTPTTGFMLSDYFVQNASFIRCDNITLGYTWNNLCHDNLKLRLFGAVQNPFVITKYKGIDPEVFNGIDSNVYPRPVTFTLGLVATF